MRRTGVSPGRQGVGGLRVYGFEVVSKEFLRSPGGGKPLANHSAHRLPRDGGALPAPLVSVFRLNPDQKERPCTPPKIKLFLRCTQNLARDSDNRLCFQPEHAARCMACQSAVLRSATFNTEHSQPTTQVDKLACELSNLTRIGKLHPEELWTSAEELHCDSTMVPAARGKTIS